MDGLRKTFGATVALKNFKIEVSPGEIHALLGENGSGKSTFIKLLSGYHSPDAPTSVTIYDNEVSLPLAPTEYRSLRMAFVHQDLGLVDDLSVLENLNVDTLTDPRRLGIRWREQTRYTRRVLETHQIPARPAALVGSLPRHVQTLIAIARASERLDRLASLTGEAGGLLVLDEPTAALTGDERRRLHRAISEFRDSGGAVVLVSHDIDEALQLTDQITVLRDGEVVHRSASAGTTPEKLVEMIVGYVPTGHERAAREFKGASTVVVRNLVGGGRAPLGFEVSPGEVLGVTGLAASGLTEILASIYGSTPADDGELELDGRVHSLRSMTPAKAVAAGVAFVPAKRLQSGCVADLSIRDNITLSRIGELGNRWFLSRRKIREAAATMAAEFTVSSGDPGRPLSALSGGNQQKVLLAKYMSLKPSLLLLDEPTQGVDVGARSEIFRLLAAAAEEGAAIVCASSDWEQLELICDRVIVVADGAVTAELVQPGLTKAKIADACFRVAEPFANGTTQLGRD